MKAQADLAKVRPWWHVSAEPNCRFSSPVSARGSQPRLTLPDSCKRIPIVAGEGQVAHHQHVGHYAKCPQIDLSSVSNAREQLGGAVGWCATFGSQAPRFHSGETKVRQLDCGVCPAVRKKDVLGLDVTVCYGLLMQVVHRRHYLGGGRASPQGGVQRVHRPTTGTGKLQQRRELGGLAARRAELACPKMRAPSASPYGPFSSRRSCTLPPSTSSMAR
eukprot:scaffold90498_cov32-Tisochrysis_lutea.AAC.3